MFISYCNYFLSSECIIENLLIRNYVFKKNVRNIHENRFLMIKYAVKFNPPAYSETICYVLLKKLLLLTIFCLFLPILPFCQIYP